MTGEQNRFWQDFKWGRENHARLLISYKDKWVAIFGKKIIASGRILSKVQAKAKKITGQQLVAVKFVECGAHIYAL